MKELVCADRVHSRISDSYAGWLPLSVADSGGQSSSTNAQQQRQLAMHPRYHVYQTPDETLHISQYRRTFTLRPCPITTLNSITSRPTGHATQVSRVGIDRLRHERCYRQRDCSCLYSHERYRIADVLLVWLFVSVCWIAPKVLTEIRSHHFLSPEACLLLLFLRDSRSC